MIYRVIGIFFNILFFFILHSDKSVCQEFSYEGSMGPNHWGEKYHQCIGKHQSPINIVEHDVEIVELPELRFVNFDEKLGEIDVHNNGHTVVLFIKNGPLPIILGGPLAGKYQFAQLHFHWGQNDHEGSENKINNGSYPMELHMVFYKISYGSFTEAVQHPDGLTVLSFLYSMSSEPNPNYEKFVQLLPKIQKPRTTTIIENMASFDDLTFKDRDIYFTYGGSLTTPPCSEVVTWIEFKKTIPLSSDQIRFFRELNDLHGKLLHNFRPVQPLHGRTIRLNISPKWTSVFNEVSKYMHERNYNEHSLKSNAVGFLLRNISCRIVGLFAIYILANIFG